MKTKAKAVKSKKHLWERYEYDKRTIDIFAYSCGYHNGPKCKRCGEEFCHHCNPDCYVEECKG